MPPGDEESDEEELMFVPNIRTATGGKHSDESSDGGNSSDESNGSGCDSVEHSETSSERDGSGSEIEMVKVETTNRFGRKVSVRRITKPKKIIRYILKHTLKRDLIFFENYSYIKLFSGYIS